MLFKPVPLTGPPRISTRLAVPAAHHNYILGGEMVNAFAAGRIGAQDDLWFLALEPPAEGDEPPAALVSANILDDFGRRLVTLERNRPVFTAGSTEVVAEADGWRLTCQGREVLRVQTRPSSEAGCARTYIHCLLKDRRGRVRMETRGTAGSPSLVVHGPHAFGLRGDDTFGVNNGLAEDMLRAAAAWMRAPAAD